MADTALASTILSYCGFVITFIFLLPQIYHNFQRKATEGYSAGMCWLQTVSCVVFAARLISASQALGTILQQGAVALLCTVIVIQMYYYRPASKGKSIAHLALVCALLFLAHAAVVIGVTIGFIELFWYAADNVIDWIPLVLGDILTSVLIGVSFLPQVVTMAKMHSYAGISFLSSVLNIIADICAALAVMLQDGTVFMIIPFIVLVCGHLSILSTALFIRLCCYSPEGEKKPTSGTVTIDLAPREL